MKRALTEKVVATLPAAPNGKKSTCWDIRVPGLALRITDRGVRTFYAVRRLPGTTSPVWLMLGRFPVMTLADARNAARAALADLARGIDPRPRPAAPEPEPATTFGAVAEQYIRSHVAGLRTARAYEARLRRELVRRWANLPIAAITRRQVVVMVEEVSQAKGRSAARHAFSDCRALFENALARDIVDINPCSAVKAAKLYGPPPSRDRILSDAELRAVWLAASAMPFPFGPMVQLLMLTGQRRSEIADLRWAEVDTAQRQISIPASRYKTKRAHTIPLTPAALEILAGLPRRLDGRVFPRLNWNYPKVRLDQMSGVSDWVLHDIRRTVRSGLSAAGVGMVPAELVLGHQQRGIVAVYDRHSYAAEKRDALERWERRLLAIAGDAQAAA